MKDLKFYNSGDALFYSPSKTFVFYNRDNKINFYLNEKGLLLVWDDCDINFEIPKNLFVRLFTIEQNNQIKIILNNSIDDDILKYMDDGAEIQFKEVIDAFKKMIGSRKIYISKKYISYKNEIIKYLNENFTGEDLFE
jgi:hypothetical protein